MQENFSPIKHHFLSCLAMLHLYISSVQCLVEASISHSWTFSLLGGHLRLRKGLHVPAVLASAGISSAAASSWRLHLVLRGSGPLDLPRFLPPSWGHFLFNDVVTMTNRQAPLLRIGLSYHDNHHLIWMILRRQQGDLLVSSGVTMATMKTKHHGKVAALTMWAGGAMAAPRISCFLFILSPWFLFVPLNFCLISCRGHRVSGSLTSLSISKATVMS